MKKLNDIKLLIFIKIKNFILFFFEEDDREASS